MTYDRGSFKTGDYHPVEAYDPEWFNVAYLLTDETANDGPDGTIAARVMVNIKSRRFHAIYAISDRYRNRLKTALELLDYEDHPHVADNARFKRIYQFGSFIFPYVDGEACAVLDDGTYRWGDGGLVAGAQVGYTQSSYDTRGYCASSSAVECDDCGQFFDEEDGEVVGYRSVCPDCIESDYTWSDYHDQYVQNHHVIMIGDEVIDMHEDIHVLIDGEYHFKDDCVHLDNGNWVLPGDAVEYVTMDHCKLVYVHKLDPVVSTLIDIDGKLYLPEDTTMFRGKRVPRGMLVNVNNRRRDLHKLMKNSPGKLWFNLYGGDASIGLRIREVVYSRKEPTDSSVVSYWTIDSLRSYFSGRRSLKFINGNYSFLLEEPEQCK
jgi:hypothetical protein